MDISQKGIDFVAAHEGMSTVAYADGGGVWTIGYGHTQSVKQGDTCTRAEARLWLSLDLSTAAGTVRKYATAFLNQNQFDALCSFVYNIGAGAFSKSTCLDMIIRGEYEKAADAMLMWCKIHGVESPGLLNRRKDERTLFLEPCE